MSRRGMNRWVYVRTGEAPTRHGREVGEAPSARARVLSVRSTYTVQMPDGEEREVTGDDLLTTRRRPDPVMTDDRGDEPMGGVEDTHPAFGMIGIYHAQCTAMPVHGSRVDDHRNVVCIRLTRGASVRHDLAHDWHFGGGDTIAEVMLSPARFAEFLSAPNRGDGVPCSITYHSPVPGPGMVPRMERRRTEGDRIVERIKGLGGELQAQQEADRAEIEELLAKVPKTRRKAVLAAFDRSRKVVGDTAPFLVGSATEALESRASEVKAEVEAHMATAIRTAGVKALGGDPDVLTPGPAIEGPTPTPPVCGSSSPRVDGAVYGCERPSGHKGEHRALGDEIEWHGDDTLERVETE